MKINRNVKGQGSTEYILILAGVLIVIIIALVFVFKIGGTATKSGGLQAELLAAEYIGKPGVWIAIATNIPLPPAKPGSVNIYSGTDPKAENMLFTSNMTQVPGGYEYNLVDDEKGSVIPSPITSIQYTDTAGANVILLPASGTSITIVPDGTFPFTISQIT